MRRRKAAIREISKSQHAPAGAVSALEITNDCEPAAEEMSAQVAAVEWELSGGRIGEIAELQEAERSACGRGRDLLGRGREGEGKMLIFICSRRCSGLLGVQDFEAWKSMLESIWYLGGCIWYCDGVFGIFN